MDRSDDKKFQLIPWYSKDMPMTATAIVAQDLLNRHRNKFLDYHFYGKEKGMISVERLNRINETRVKASKYIQELNCSCGKRLEVTELEAHLASVECEEANLPGDHVSFELQFSRVQ